MIAIAAVGDDEMRVEAYGCRLKVSSLLDIDKSSADETEFTIPFDVTSPDFIKIDGVPYVKPQDESK